jgi:lipopolysaccharide/colanic/teichoic acid biosynthesis glycosyltransferase
VNNVGYRILKRLFDFIFSLIGLLFLSPFFLIIALVIIFDSEGPVFYSQVRLGKGWKRFQIFKFRTMNHDAEKNGPQISKSDDHRITRVGAFLRKYKLDELPQLINILFGDMSFVGPRPEVPKYAEYYKINFDRILQIKPGLTDFSSLKFRNENELLRNSNNVEEIYLKEILPKKFVYIEEYLAKRSLTTDITLIWSTVFAMFKSENIL